MYCKAKLHIIKMKAGERISNFFSEIQHSSDYCKDMLWQLGLTEDDLELCGGVIKARVEAYDEPYYGGTSATLEAEFRCQRCGNTSHGLPEHWQLGDFLSALLETAEDEVIEKALKKMREYWG